MRAGFANVRKRSRDRPPYAATRNPPRRSGIADERMGTDFICDSGLTPKSEYRVHEGLNPRQFHELSRSPGPVRHEGFSATFGLLLREFVFAPDSYFRGN